jgi:hypothetical protein
MAGQLRRSAADQSDDDLPDHLAALLEQDCDAVLNDHVVQRATNLAWNVPTTNNVAEHVDGMDTIVDDPAVRSPMDAVAAWFSTQTLHRSLLASLSTAADKEREHIVQTEKAVADDAYLAVRTAPIGSSAQVRALVGLALLVDEKREANVETALQAVGPPLNPVTTNNSIKCLASSAIVDTTGSATVDEQTTLRCAAAINDLRRLQPSSPTHDCMRLVETIALPNALPTAAAATTLLGCAAAFKLMEELFAHRAAAEAFSSSLERLAGSLRIWVGSAAGGKCGLEQRVRHAMVDRCLAVTKSVVGMENDTGYGSMSDCDEEGC